ncbi:MAG: AMP-binding protein [Desulfotalea sp.]
MVNGSDVGMTLNYLIDSSREKYADLPAVGMAMGESLTYKEFHHRIFALAAKMRNEGVVKGDRIAILAENSDKWGLVYLAVVRLGAICVPILPDLPESDVSHILTEMKVKMLYLSQRQLEKIDEYGGDLDAKIITLDNTENLAGTFAVSGFNNYLQEALVSYEQNDVENFVTVKEDDVASIIYTSGTSGYSKAVMLSHKNLTANAYAASGLADIKPGAVWLSILPISHTYEFTCGFILPLLCGARIAYAGKTPTPAILQKLCKHEKPFAIFAVPLVLEKIYKKRVQPQIEKKKLLSLACKTSVGRRMVHRKIGAKLIDFFGGNLGLMGIGGAALNPEVERFLHEAEFPYLIGYGMTEAGPLIAGGPLGDKSIAVTSTGKPIPGVKVRIDNPNEETGIGEIMVSGANVMKGYYNDDEQTKEVLSDDCWLATGDLGRLDEHGNLFITGRSKNVIVMANGENVYPEIIEHKVNSYQWVLESLVVQKNEKLEAWVYPDYEYMDEQAPGKNSSERRNLVGEMLEEMRASLNKELSAASRITKIIERREPFAKTATHKIKRYLYEV